MTMKLILAGALIAAASGAALAQQSGTATVVTSEPGKASVVQTVQNSAEVVGIDKATRTVTLKTPQGDKVDVVAGDAVKNFDQIKVGDVITARYTRALALRLKDTREAAGGLNVTEGSSTAPPGKAGFTQITTTAEVTAVDPKASTITLKGKEGKTVTLDVRNPDQFKVVKPGDKVEVTYAEAVALAFEPAAKPMPEKSK